MSFDNFNMKQKILFFLAAYIGIFLIAFIYFVTAWSVILMIKQLAT